MIFNPEFRELIRATHRPSQRHRAQQHSPAQDDDRDGVTTGDGADPDDRIDPDDLTGRTPVWCALLLPPPAQSEAWWTALVFGRENDAVSPQDASLALAHVAYRLGIARSNTGFPVTTPTTLGELHEAIEEHYGGPGWTALMECWHEAAGIAQPTRSHADIPKRIPKFGSPSSPSFSSSHMPSPENEVEALRRLPADIRRFWLREEPASPPWRTSLPPDGMDEGSWCG